MTASGATVTYAFVVLDSGQTVLLAGTDANQVLVVSAELLP